MRTMRGIENEFLKGELPQKRTSRAVSHATRPSAPSRRWPGPAPPSLTHEAAAAQELYGLTRGPTCVPIYGLLGVMRIIYPERGAQHFAVARWLIQTAKVPVNAPDLSGTLSTDGTATARICQAMSSSLFDREKLNRGG
ncbi:hypothetical protein DFH08DRAFT_1023724 [Mycena albidolilacea]|uniref:Uncharacterized protein n=1 Tax=Mycena albidolilacea TaxID=1033008 RepID=A0AAD6ZMB0_9AGAR|nr:hypothetical protein DFH08DRAFT_1023724 [Mycena albidolilacea]